MTIDDKLSFKMHITNICQKAKYKFHALQRIKKYLSNANTKTLCNVFISSLLCYAPLIWMVLSVSHKSKKKKKN